MSEQLASHKLSSNYKTNQHEISQGGDVGYKLQPIIMLGVHVTHDTCKQGPETMKFRTCYSLLPKWHCMIANKELPNFTEKDVLVY